MILLLSHVLDSSLRGHQIIQGMCSLLLMVLGRGILMGKSEDEAMETIFGTGIGERPKFLSVGKPQSTQLSQQGLGTLVSFPAGKCCLSTILWQGGRYPLPGYGLKSKHRLGRAQETQLFPHSCALVHSLTTSVQLCYPKHRTQALPLPTCFFLLSHVGINMRPPKTHHLLTVQALYPSRADCISWVFFPMPCLKQRNNLCLGAVHPLAVYPEAIPHLLPEVASKCFPKEKGFCFCLSQCLKFSV